MTINIGDVKAGRDVNVSSTVNTYMPGILEAAEKEEFDTAEGILNSLPADALEVILGALESPLKAIGVVVEKLMGKYKLLKKEK